MLIFETYAALTAAIENNTFRFLPQFGPAAFVCSVCKQQGRLNTEGKGVSCGYAIDSASENFVCFDCAADRDRADMKATGRATLYLSRVDGAWRVSNWPGTLALHPRHVRKGRHNFARVRHDVWFSFEGEEWHGVNYGDFSQILHCKRLKAA